MTEIKMPQLGETIIEGTILQWLKKEGDTVARDEPLFEISTDKVDTEVPSPVAGTVTKILVEEGSTVPVNTVVMEIDAGEAGGGASATAAESPGAEEPAAPEAPAAEAPAAEAPEAAASTPAPGASGGAGAPGSSVPTSRDGGTTAPPAAPPSPSKGSDLPDRGPRSKILSPLVRRLAAEHGVDLASIQGSGEGGRITKQDVLGAVERPAAAAATPTGPGLATVTPLRAPAPAVAAQAAEGDAVEPMSHIRKAIAEHMVSSVQTTARAWTMVEVNVEHLVRLRERSKDAFAERHGVTLTYLPFVVRATVDALGAFPAVNARIAGEDIVTPKAVHMGIAVSYDLGLIVPVIKHAEAMSTVGIAAAIADLAARARAHKLQPDEVQGATFTITNPGPYGSVASVPIINLPNAGILSLDAIVKRPVVIDDAIAIRSIVNISMSWDHRLIDGEVATRFLARVRQNLETWDFAEDLGLSNP
jgi:2-oxoglutarate dehydrogenase E2 component (dihydrolipoamide succinyltransferase)